MLSWPSLFHVEQALSVTGFQGHPAPGEAPDLAALLAAILPEMPARERSVARERLAGYASLVAQWASRVNLVSLQDLPHFAERHVVAALALRPAMRSVPHDNVIDVGSGAGLPGIPLAITLPSSTVTLVESRRRRANFLRQATRQLALHNVQVVCSRVEDWSPPIQADMILSRAVSDPETLLRLAGHCLTPAGFLLVTSGPRTENRIAEMSAFLTLQSAHLKPRQALLLYPSQRP